MPLEPRWLEQARAPEPERRSEQARVPGPVRAQLWLAAVNLAALLAPPTERPSRPESSRPKALRLYVCRSSSCLESRVPPFTEFNLASPAGCFSALPQPH
jgi:hypothetical protein